MTESDIFHIALALLLLADLVVVNVALWRAS
jgi:hypothetical protein